MLKPLYGDFATSRPTGGLMPKVFGLTLPTELCWAIVAFLLSTLMHVAISPCKARVGGSY